jgi:protein O-mannosyl-transferase
MARAKTSNKKKELAKPPQQIAKPAPHVFKPNLWLALVCALAGFLLYANSIANGYVLDDVSLIFHNQYIAEGIKGIPKLFGIDVWHFMNTSLGYYRPLSFVTFAIENQFFPQNPHVAHLGNVILYAITGFFVCMLLMQVFREYHPAFSFLITMLFLAHPIHTEVVANIKSRDEILSFLNMIIAAYAFLIAVRSSGKIPLILSFVFFYLALLSKETAITGLIILPVVLFFGTGLSFKQIALKSWPFIVLLVIFQYQKFVALGTISGRTVHDAVNYPYAIFEAKFPSSFMILMWCVKLIWLPYPLSYNYAYNQLPPADFSSPATWAGIALLVVTFYFLFANFNKKTPANFGLIIWTVALAPAIGFVLVKGGILAERVLHAPALGFSVLLIWYLSKALGINFQSPETSLKSLLKKAAFSIPLVLILTLYTIETFSRNKIWHDDMTLYSHDVEVAANSCQTHLHYGMLLINTGASEKDSVIRQAYFNKCLEQFRTSVFIKDLNPEAHFGIAWANQVFGGSTDSIIYYCRLSITEAPTYFKPYKVLGTVYESLDKQRLASYYFNKAVELNPYDDEAVAYHQNHVKNTGLDIKNIADTENDDSRREEAENKEYARYRDMGKDYGNKHDYPNALKYLQKAAEIKPKSPEALSNLAICYGLTGNYQKSVEILNTMLAIYPDSKFALQTLIVCHDELGNKALADEYRKRLAALNSNNPTGGAK